VHRGANVRYGSLADIGGALADVRFPEADMLIVGFNVRYVPEADIELRRGRRSGFTKSRQSYARPIYVTGYAQPLAD
jgi:hypothetical protein